jgi:hypothetical protein
VSTPIQPGRHGDRWDSLPTQRREDEMAQAHLAVHRTILVVDVEGFGDRHRTNPHQVAIRAGLYRVLRHAFYNSGISWESCRWEDRGDAVFVLASPEVPKALFTELLPHMLVAALRQHNTTHRATERMRLRMAVHAGEVNFDNYGATAQSINLTFRLVDANPLKSALAGSPGVLALITSSWFFDEVIRQTNSGDWTRYRPVSVAVKETNAVGWIYLPDSPDVVEPTQMAPADQFVSRSCWLMDVSGCRLPLRPGTCQRTCAAGTRYCGSRVECRRRPGHVIVPTGLGEIGKSTIAALANRLRRRDSAGVDRMCGGYPASPSTPPI